MNTSDFSFVFLGQSILRYQVPLDIINTINSIYETKRPELPPANMQLVGKIKNEHSLFFDGPPNKIMHPHNFLPQNVHNYIISKVDHYLNWNKIRDYKIHTNSIWVNEMDEHEYNPVHVHRGALLTGVAALMVLKLPDNMGKEYSSPQAPMNGKLQMMGAVNGHFAHCDYSPQLKERDLYIFPYDMRHCVYPFNGNGKRRTMPCNIDVDYDPIQNRGVM